MKSRSVLIVGAGIAGPVLAYFLRRSGLSPVVVERAPSLRATGQTIDVRGAGKEVVRRMGVDEVVRARVTREDGIALVDKDGQTLAAFPADSFGGGGLVSEIEILRGELVKVLYDRGREEVEYIFDDHPTAIADRGDRVEVTFASGLERAFDLVIGADGLRSRTRRLAFPSRDHIQYLDLYSSYFTIPYSASDGRWARLYNAPGGRTVTLRPDNLGTTRAFLSVRTAHRGHEELSVEDQKRTLHQWFADAGFETPRVLKGMDEAKDFYFEAIGQVKMDRWSVGRVALVGDAGYCPSPISGMGTSLALVGSYILAGELGRHDNHVEAFAQYERLMRPYVKKAQKIFTPAVDIVSPQTQAGITISRAILGLVARPAVLKLLGRLMDITPAEKISLPVYEQANRAA
jgi:2-polyprenyl-6-methoxyphenol hydroxylase-like FAD-dependent oxidoreductase